MAGVPPALSKALAWRSPPAVVAASGVELRPRGRGRVHLGCGEVYLDGYLNVDLPPAEGTARGMSRPDVEADITRLACPGDSLEEVRLHHVFEHFERAQALALMIRWQDWLRPGGRLALETPDFDACIRGFDERAAHEQALILRHVFGSQEAPWARHLHGWSEPRFREAFDAFGFERVEVDATLSDEAGLLKNVIATARKARRTPPRSERRAAAEALLRRSMNGDTDTERTLLGRWLAALDATLAG